MQATQAVKIKFLGRLNVELDFSKSILKKSSTDQQAERQQSYKIHLSFYSTWRYITLIWRSNPRSSTLANAAVKANKAEKANTAEKANRANKAGKNYYSNSLSSLSSRSRSSLFNSYVVILILSCVVFMDSVSLADGLRQEQIKYRTLTDTEKFLLTVQII